MLFTIPSWLTSPCMGTLTYCMLPLDPMKAMILSQITGLSGLALMDGAALADRVVAIQLGPRMFQYPRQNSLEDLVPSPLQSKLSDTSSVVKIILLPQTEGPLV